MKYWVVHHTPSGCMNRDGWMKVMINIKTVCGTNKLNIQVLFYDDHVRHFDGRAIHIIRSNHIKPFILKAGDSGNYQPNDNGHNLKLKGLYGQARMKWQRQHGTPKFTNSHMNYVLVETWKAFKLSSDPVVINASKKKSL